MARFMVGMNAYHMGDYGKAAETFSSLNPGYDVLVNFGASLAGSGDATAAASLWRRALELSPSGSEAAFNLGYLAFSQGEWELAISRLAQFLEDHPRDSEAVFLLGRAYDKAGRAEESRRLTARAIRMSPRLERWLSQPLPNLARVRTQFNAAELRLPVSAGVWNDARRVRRTAAQDAGDALRSPRP